MLTALRKKILLSVLLALCFSLASCDSSGSNGDSPAWTGNWKTGDDYLFLTTDKFDAIEAEEGESGCESIGRGDIVETDGNTITVFWEIEKGVPELEDQTIRYVLEPSGENLTISLQDPEADPSGYPIGLADGPETVNSTDTTPEDLSCS